MHPIGILFCVLVSIGYCTDTKDTPAVNVAFYCPKNKTWGYDIKAYLSDFGKTDPNKDSLDCDHKSNSFNTTFTFKCESGDIFYFHGVLITIEHSCTSNGDVQKVEVMSEDPGVSEAPMFVAWNLGNNDHAAAYEKLLVPYMKEECGKDDCGQVRKQIQDSCNKKKLLNMKKQCHDGLGRALRIYCNSDGGDNRHTICTKYVTSTTKTTSTTKLPESSNLVPIIIGASVATIVLIGGLICFLKCRQGKKKRSFGSVW